MTEVSTERLRSMASKDGWIVIEEVQSMARAELKRREEFADRCMRAADRIKDCHSRMGKYNIIQKSMSEPLEPEIEDKWLRAADDAHSAQSARTCWTQEERVGVAKAIRKAVEGT